MRSVFVVAIIAISFFASCALAVPPPTAEAIRICQQVGVSSGCSGCNAPSIDCEWCTEADHDLDGQCVPEGFCQFIRGSNYVVKPYLCPAIAKQEPRHKGLSKSDPETFTSHFVNNYCEFPIQPWPVDRTASPFYNNDPTGNCLRVNNQLTTGQRMDIESCLRSKGVTKEPILTEKRKECLRLYQSLQCTFGCVEYGVPMDFTRMCPEMCERFNQHCDSNLQECMKTVGLDTSSYFACTSKDDPKCYTPKLIQPSGKFEFDLCFYGDPSRCKSTDCVVKLFTGQWPAQFVTMPHDDHTHGAASGYVAGSSGPACCFSSWTNSHFGLAYEVVSPPTPGGLSCDVAFENLLIAKYGGDYNHYDSWWCTDGNGYWTDTPQAGALCGVVVSLNAGTNGVNRNLNGCTSAANNNNCPGFIQWLDD